jgi:hypothetical protein
MLFMHYADMHPLFTYALYSPTTKRIVFRQDCIFLPTLFPMRQARSEAGQNPDGECLITYRSPGEMRDGPPVVSFHDWTEADPFPAYDDDVSGFELYSPGCFPEEVDTPRPEDHPGHCPRHPDFAPSFVHVPAPTVSTGKATSIPQPGPVVPDALPRRSSRAQGSRQPSRALPDRATRGLVKQRWFYEPVQEASLSCSKALMLGLITVLAGGCRRAGVRTVSRIGGCIPAGGTHHRRVG